MCIVLTWPVLLKAQQVIGCSMASDVLSLVRASLSQNENRPSDPTVASVPVIARKNRQITWIYIQVDFRHCFMAITKIDLKTSFSKIKICILKN